MTYNVIHNALVNKVQTQAICDCRITARAVIWSRSYFPNVSIFLLTALGGLPENPGINHFWWITKKNKKWSSLFPTCTHATFLINKRKNSHHKGNKWNQLHANFLAKCEPFLSDSGCLHTVLNGCSCLYCALLIVARNQLFSTFYTATHYSNPL